MVSAAHLLRNLIISHPKFDEADERQNRRREEAIDAAYARSVAKGEVCDRFVLGIMYDNNDAPMTTNRAQLAERGFLVPDLDDLTDEELPGAIVVIATALARLGVFFARTDHFDDRTFYARLCLGFTDESGKFHESILDEQVREKPTGDVASEIIDCLGTGPTAQNLYYAMYATDEERAVAASSGFHVPPKQDRKAHRDAKLPKHSRVERNVPAPTVGGDA